MKRKYALITGISLLLMGIAAGYAYGYVYSNLVVKENSAETIQNIQSSKGMFIGGIVGWITIFILDLLVSWGVYKFFQDTHYKLSLTTAMVRVVYTIILGFAISYLFTALSLVESSTNAVEVLSALSSFESVWSLGLIIFGLHLLGLGLLSLKDSSVPNIFGWLLIIAGFSYFAIHGAKALLPGSEEQINTVEMILTLPMAIGEIAFAIWLVIKGGK